MNFLINTKIKTYSEITGKRYQDNHETINWWKYNFNVNFPHVLEASFARLFTRRQDCSSVWTTMTTMTTTTTTTTTMSTMSTTMAATTMTTRTTTTTRRTTTTAAASCFLLVVSSKGESWCFSDGISGVVTSGTDRSHSGLQICHPQPARPCAWPRIERKSLLRSLLARCTLQVKQGTSSGREFRYVVLAVLV